MKKLLITGVSALALLVAMVGCEIGTGAVAGPSIDSITAKLVTGLQPTGNETQQQQEGMSVRIDITVSDFEVVDSIGDNITDNATIGQGDGYYVYYLDRLPAALQEEAPVVPTPTLTPGQEQEMAWASTETSLTWNNLTQGIHFFSVQLVDAGGTPLTPPVVAAAALTVPAPQQEPSGEQPGGQTATVNLMVDDTGFNMMEITVPANAEVTINLENTGDNPHNLSVYQTQAATTSIFIGNTVQAGDSGTYTFTVPSESGTYYFRDDENLMASGGFIVE